MALLTLAIDSHPSVGEEALGRAVIDSLRANRIDPKLLYITLWQVQLWRQVFLRHSPIHGNSEFARIYRDAFTRVAESTPPGRIWLVGLGCGTGLKEAELCLRLKACGHAVSFSAVDVSRDLVEESGRRLAEAGAELARGLVCDLTATDFVAKWLKDATGDVPRAFTFFGLTPNLAPSLVARLFTAILRPGDRLLANAHLAPVGAGADLSQAMQAVLPQYDNPQTLAWLSAALEEWKLLDRVEAVRMQIGEIEGVPAFVARASWKSAEPFERSGERFHPKTAEPLQLFHSLRYTPALFEAELIRAGFHAELLAMTSCREEAIWAVQR